jgi:hypothetical protein
MGFSIGYDIGPLGGLFLIVLIGAGLIALAFLLAAARRARIDVIEEDADHHDVIR